MHVYCTSPPRACPLPAWAPDLTSGRQDAERLPFCPGPRLWPFVERGQPRPRTQLEMVRLPSCAPACLGGVACPRWVSSSVSSSPTGPGEDSPRSSEQDPGFLGHILVFGPDSPTGSGMTIRWAWGWGQAACTGLSGPRAPRPGAHKVAAAPGAWGGVGLFAGRCLLGPLSLHSVPVLREPEPGLPWPWGWLETVILRSARLCTQQKSVLLLKSCEPCWGGGRMERSLKIEGCN